MATGFMKDDGEKRRNERREVSGREFTTASCRPVFVVPYSTATSSHSAPFCPAHAKRHSLHCLSTAFLSLSGGHIKAIYSASTFASHVLFRTSAMKLKAEG